MPLPRVIVGWTQEDKIGVALTTKTKVATRRTTNWVERAMTTNLRRVGVRYRVGDCGLLVDAVDVVKSKQTRAQGLAVVVLRFSDREAEDV